MEQIVEQLIKLNRRDWLDIVGILLPIILTIVIIIQNRIYSRIANDLQKQIHNRDWVNRHHDYILSIYNIYYDFCDTIINSGFKHNVENANIYLVTAWTNNLVALKLSINRKLNLAKLLFGQNKKELYSIIEDRFILSVNIIDKYLEYINSGKLWSVSENAWSMICSRYPLMIANKYNYALLEQNEQMHSDYIKLCKSEELEGIYTLIKEHEEKHSYDNFDKYFEEYFSLDEL